MAVVVLDSSAVIALLRKEPGADRIRRLATDAAISAVNLQEVAKELLRSGIELTIVAEMLGELHLDVIAHGEDDALQAASLMAATTQYGSGLGDRSCMALAIRLGVPALTTDRAWSKLSIPGLVVELAR